MRDLFDFNRIREELGMDSEDVRQLMTIYRSELHKDFTELDGQIQTMNWLFLKNKLHKMKGDAANMYLSPISDAFTEMEHTILKKDPDLLILQLHSVKKLESQFAESFEAYLNSGDSM